MLYHMMPPKHESNHSQPIVLLVQSGIFMYVLKFHFELQADEQAMFY